jgi:hypothetical protein
MTDTTWQWIGQQLGGLGFGEAVTPGLRANLEKGDAAVEVKMAGRRMEDDIQATLRLWKPDGSDFYYLHDFDLQLRKLGHAGWVKQNFQQSERPYTLQEAYNLLSGRPVFQRPGNPENGMTEAWLKLDFSQRLENGNYPTRYYHASDAFHLERVLNQYPIRELRNPDERKRLIETLRKGNVAAATFDGKSGDAVRLYVTPSLPTWSLVVQDGNGIRLPVDKLLEKVNFSQTLKSRHQLLQEPSEHEQKRPAARQRKRLGLH